MRILVIEDEKNLNDIIVKRLILEKYGVDTCFNGNDALEYIFSTEYDVIVSDIMLPGIDGFEILKRIREKEIKTPVLLLTALDGIEDRVKGLDYGADDYLVKPFAFDELMARIRVLLRRNSTNGNFNASNVFSIANLRVNCNSHDVFRDDVPIKLSTREFTILEYMIRNKERVLSREQIEQHIWNYDYEGGTNVIDVYIRYLRRKIDKDFEPKLIHTVRGIGYVLKVE
ncbi:putative transcriptional regulatory protein CusR [Leptotrichia wadei]|jgi:DNA-binding response regulator trcR|uniref:Putative transcriptional regulatory protein CusR n=2 Tax=Leptotrichia wadei TaxID=157687 RepID=A0A134A1K8_9FUSO|nr:response regulator transcription factor [Leptotrichia wadei]ERK54025.1 putative transcriptional regulatory protein CusR [Leptotrichia wadei F0279]KXB61564.1 putative transcriptional regulatory protein CusR [Leptotrichia wadei]BBM47700.1 winged helix family two component transcriptional regulator [Leptotrichia wadei]BBM50005.1 winged helix family two component transcriptional regulator [Leptotrichia wadei]